MRADAAPRRASPTQGDPDDPSDPHTTSHSHTKSENPHECDERTRHPRRGGRVDRCLRGGGDAAAHAPGGPHGCGRPRQRPGVHHLGDACAAGRRFRTGPRGWRHAARGRQGDRQARSPSSLLCPFRVSTRAVWTRCGLRRAGGPPTPRIGLALGSGRQRRAPAHAGTHGRSRTRRGSSAGSDDPNAQASQLIA